MNIAAVIIASVIFLGGAVAVTRETKKTKPTRQNTASVNTPTQVLPMNTPTPLPWKNTTLPKYPNVRIITQSESSVIFESHDDVDVITTWYKEKITSMGMNAKSFVVTKTNGNVLNKLVGSNGTGEIRVEISKSDSESSVRIVVTYHTS